MADLRQRGFTLMELLIVVALIGVLAAIAMPRFTSTATTGQVSKCKANLQSIEMALETYYSELGSYPTSGDVPALVSAGYLKLAPDCTDQNDIELGQYIWNDGSTGLPVNFEYKKNGVVVGTTSLSYVSGRAFCTYHGTLNDADFYENGYEAPGGEDPPPPPPPS